MPFLTFSDNFKIMKINTTFSLSSDNLSKTAVTEKDASLAIKFQ